MPAPETKIAHTVPINLSNRRAQYPTSFAPKDLLFQLLGQRLSPLETFNSQVL